MSVVVSRLFHAGYQFVASNTRILFDPIFENPMSVNCYSHNEIEFDHNKIKQLNFDAVFISHVHDDHFSLQSLQFLDKKIPIYIYCYDHIYIELIIKLGFHHVFQLFLSHQIQIKEFQITCLPALDREIDCLFHIQSENLNILNVVDAWIDWETCHYLSKLAKWDLILWPFQQMREIEVVSPSRYPPADQKTPAEHQTQLKMLMPKVVIPSSCQFIHEKWSWYRHHYFPISYRSFAEQVSQILPDTKVIRLDPACSLQLSEHGIVSAQPISWIKIIESSKFDYQYHPEFRPQDMNDIASRFPLLSIKEQEQIELFLNNQIIEKWFELDQEIFEYPVLPLYWKIILYSIVDPMTKQTQVKEYCYRLNQDHLQHVKSIESHDVHWLTEIIDYKLYQALHHGESLSSLYIRINDRKVIDKEFPNIIDFEITADPLLRILYEGKIAYFQKHQLMKIQMLNND